MIKLKLPKPKKKQKNQFRITKKYRVLEFYKENGFIVTEISDH